MKLFEAISVIKNKLNVFERLEKALQKDLVIGIIIMLCMAIGALAVWGVNNQRKTERCQENFSNFTQTLQEQTEKRYDAEKKKNDSLIAEIMVELKRVKKDKEDVEKQLQEVKQRK